MRDLTATILRNALSYSPETGEFRWLVRSAYRVNVGDLAGANNGSGYVLIQLNGRKHKAHRLAWLHFYGEFPGGEIDHINGIRSDNRISNLRDVTKAHNQQNQRRAHKNKRSCARLGVGFYKANGKWRARINVCGKQRHLGFYESESEAYSAYLSAKAELHPFGAIATEDAA